MESLTPEEIKLYIEQKLKEKEYRKAYNKAYRETHKERLRELNHNLYLKRKEVKEKAHAESIVEHVEEDPV